MGSKGDSQENHLTEDPKTSDKEDQLMKANITTMVRATVLGAALLLSSPAWAGLTYNSEVVVGSSYAYGSKASARYSADPTQYIGCFIGAGVSSPYVSCFAV